MTSKRKIIKVFAASVGLLLLVILVVFAYIFSSLHSALSSWNPPPNEYVIYFEEVGETLYIRASTWGLAGNHQEIIIANSPNNNTHVEYYKDRQIVYLDNTELYYKKVGSDTLEIYVGMPAEIPKGFTSKVKVKQFKLDFDEARRCADHYKEYGLSKVSVYPIN